MSYRVRLGVVVNSQVNIRKVNVAAIMSWVAKTLAELSVKVNADKFVQFLENFLKRKVRGLHIESQLWQPRAL